METQDQHLLKLNIPTPVLQTNEKNNILLFKINNHFSMKTLFGLLKAK